MSEGMILAEDELDLGADHSGIIVLDDALEAGTPLVDVLPLVDEVLDLEATGNRADLFAVYGVAREVAALLGGELLPMPGEEPERDGDEAVGIAIDDPEGCLRFIGRVYPRRRGRRVTAVAEGAPAACRRAGDLERRGRDELRHARARQPAPRLRPRPAPRRARRAPRAQGREGADARRRRAHAERRGSRDRRRRARGRARRDHGRRGDRGLRLDDERPARGGELRAGRDPAQLRAARAAHRGLEPAGRRASTRTSQGRRRPTRRS